MIIERVEENGDAVLIGGLAVAFERPADDPGRIVLETADSQINGLPIIEQAHFGLFPGRPALCRAELIQLRDRCNRTPDRLIQLPVNPDPGPFDPGRGKGLSPGGGGPGIEEDEGGGQEKGSDRADFPGRIQRSDIGSTSLGGDCANGRIYSFLAQR